MASKAATESPDEGSGDVQTRAVILEKAEGRWGCSQRSNLVAPGAGDLVVDIRLLRDLDRNGKTASTPVQMPPFPGMGYPLVPGYESAGERWSRPTPKDAGFKPGDHGLCPGCFNCYSVRSAASVGGAAARLVTKADRDRLVVIDAATGPEGALLALAATAHHAIAAPHAHAPDLIIGHGVLGRLLARLSILRGGPPPVVWEKDLSRLGRGDDYPVVHPDDDDRRDYRSIYDASGDAALLDTLIGRLAKGGEIVLAGFYAQPISFAFPMAFIKEARLRVAAEWARDDIEAVRALLDGGKLALADLITHTVPASDAPYAYRTAFTDSNCLKMILDWRASA